MLQRPCRSTQPPHVWEARLANQVSLNGTAADAGTGMDATSSNVDPSHLLTREHCCYGFLYSSDLGFPLDSVQSFLGEPRHSRYNSGDSSQDKSIYEGLSGFLGKSFPSTVLLCSRVSYWITSRTIGFFCMGQVVKILGLVAHVVSIVNILFCSYRTTTKGNTHDRGICFSETLPLKKPDRFQPDHHCQQLPKLVGPLECYPLVLNARDLII